MPRSGPEAQGTRARMRVGWPQGGLAWSEHGAFMQVVGMEVPPLLARLRRALRTDYYRRRRFRFSSERSEAVATASTLVNLRHIGRLYVSL